MKDLSRRTLDLTQSDIRAVTRLVDAAGGINLGQGICDMPVPDAIKAAAHRAVDGDESVYTHFAGLSRLRRAVLEKARDYNRLPAASEDEVMISVGSTGAFVTAAFALLDPDDEAVVFEPFYGYHRNLIRLTGATVRCVPARGRDWEIDFDALSRAVTARTKVLVVCTPGNPSGKVWRRDELERLLVLMERHDLYAITDEIYEYMVYDDHEHISLGSIPDAYDRTVTLSGFSKTYNMTGWRLGYAVGPARLLDKMGLLGDLFYICAPTPLQAAVVDAFAMSPAYFDGLKRDYAEKRRIMCGALEECGFDVWWPQGAYYVMADFSPLTRVRSGFEDDRQACRTLIEEAGVATVPGSSFFEDPASGRRFLRFCYAKEVDVLERACEQLTTAFRAAV